MWMQYSSEFLALALVHFLAVLLPGPDFAITVRNSVRYGYAIGCITAIGIGIGISVHVLYTLVGLGIIIQQSPFFMLILRIAGALYLIYLGWSLLRAPSVNIDPSIEEMANMPLSQSKAFIMGFMTNALNPKATIFFLAHIYHTRQSDNSDESTICLWDMDVYRQCTLVHAGRCFVFSTRRSTAIFKDGKTV